MLEGFKRLFTAGQPAPAKGWEGIAPWAEGRQYSFRGVQSEGFVIDGRLGATPWRLEWGPSQRPYILGQELRLRAEMGLVSDLQVVLLNRVLQEQMEKDVFEQYVEGVQTRIDNQTPPEMRWLVMFPKLPGADMGPLHENYVALSSMKGWVQKWLQGPLMDCAGRLACGPGHAAGADDRARPADAAHRRWPNPKSKVCRSGCACSRWPCAKRAAWPTTATTPSRPARSPACGLLPARCPATNTPSRAGHPRGQAGRRLISARGRSLPSSSLAMALRCTSSGPSAKRSVRARV
jgi:hypothetical protein